MDEIHISRPTRGNSWSNNTRRTSLILRRDQTRNFSLSSEPGILCAQLQRLISRALCVDPNGQQTLHKSFIAAAWPNQRSSHWVISLDNTINDFPFWLELEICDMLNSKHLFMLKFKFWEFRRTTIHYDVQRCISLLNKPMLQTELKVFENS
jgi:hypothetical protein